MTSNFRSQTENDKYQDDVLPVIQRLYCNPLDREEQERHDMYLALQAKAYAEIQAMVTAANTQGTAALYQNCLLTKEVAAFLLFETTTGSVDYKARLYGIGQQLADTYRYALARNVSLHLRKLGAIDGLE